MNKRIRIIPIRMWYKKDWCFYVIPTIQISRTMGDKLLLTDFAWLFFKIRISIKKGE